MILAASYGIGIHKNVWNVLSDISSILKENVFQLTINVENLIYQAIVPAAIQVICSKLANVIKLIHCVKLLIETTPVYHAMMDLSFTKEAVLHYQELQI